MSKFVVDAHTLRAVSRTLGQLSGTLNGLPVVTSSYISDGVVGGDPLEHELTAFNTRWHHGVTVVSGEITDMMRRLAGAADAYQRIDDTIGSRAHNHPTGAPPKVGGPGSGAGHPHPGAHKRGGPTQVSHPVGRPPAVAGGGNSTGTTVIGGGGGARNTSAHRSGGHRGGSGTGTTIIGGGPITVSSSLLTSGQATFVGKLATLTGLDPRILGAWVLSEESGSAAGARQSDDNNNWLNIGYFDSGRGGISYDEAFKDPNSAAEQTAKFLKGDWGGASPSIRNILQSAGQGPEGQLKAIYSSDWASSHYDGAAGNPPGTLLHETYHELSGMKVHYG